MHSLFHYAFLLEGVSCITISSLEAADHRLLTQAERIAHNKALYEQVGRLIKSIPGCEPHRLDAIVKQDRMVMYRELRDLLCELKEYFKTPLRNDLDNPQQNYRDFVPSISEFQQKVKDVISSINARMQKRLDDLARYNVDDSLDLLLQHFEDINSLEKQLLNLSEAASKTASPATHSHEHNGELWKNTLKECISLIDPMDSDFFNRSCDLELLEEIIKLYDDLAYGIRSARPQLIAQARDDGFIRPILSCSRQPTGEELRILAPVQAAFPGAKILIVDAQSYQKGLGICGLKDPDYFLHLLDAPAEEFRQALDIHFYPVVDISPEILPFIQAYCQSAETDFYYRRILVGLMANLQTPYTLKRMMLDFPLITLKLALPEAQESSIFDLPRLKIQVTPPDKEGSFYQGEVVFLDTTRGDQDEYPCFITNSSRAGQECLYKNIGVGVEKMSDTASHEFVHFLADVLSTSKFRKPICTAYLAEQFQNIKFFNQTDPTRAPYFWDNQYETFQIPGVSVFNADGQLIDVLYENKAQYEPGKAVVKTVMINTLCDWAGQVYHNLSPTFSHKGINVLGERAHDPNNTIESIGLSDFSKGLLNFYKHTNE